MRLFILAFAVGIVGLQQMPFLPSLGALISVSILLTCATVMVCLMRRPRLKAWCRWIVIGLLAFVCGVTWAAWRAEVRLADSLPESLEQQDVEIVGVVADLPRKYDDGMQRFRFRVEKSEQTVPQWVRLSWYSRGWDGSLRDVPEVRAGQRWRFTVRLRRPHSLMNPHGGDQEARLLERNVRAIGHVRDTAPHELADEFVLRPMHAVHRVRDGLRERFQETLPEAPYAGILVALAVGDQQSMSDTQWDVFRRTGVAHLVSISGLHVSLVALFFGALGAWLWRCRPTWLLVVPAAKAGAACGLVAAGVYALLAGFGLPTQRALIMLAAGALAMMMGREILTSRVLLIALFSVLIFDPWAVLSPGFWLSFGAVAIIVLVVAGRLRPPGKLAASVRVQLAITLALMPLLLSAFHGFSLVSPLANAIAIPLVSFVITPLVLTAILVPWSPLLELAHGMTGLMMSGLQWLSALPFAMWHSPAVPLSLVLLAVAGVAWLLLPRGTPGKAAAVLALLPMLTWLPQRPAIGDFRVAVLDVGQGLAVHVQTAEHDLLYDTGPLYGPTSDAGRRVLVPYLAASGVGRVDRMLLSHPHVDHTGGAASVLEALEVDKVKANLDDDHALQAIAQDRLHTCKAGTSWVWDDVVFELLYPGENEARFVSPNDASCVLRISSAGAVVLLPGDVEMAAEWQLLRDYRGELESDIVLAPHHGSLTSSTPPFVREVNADHVIHSAGRLNHFGHPHPQVLARWAEIGAMNWRTDAQGAILIEVAEDGYELAAYREREKRYWHGR